MEPLSGLPPPEQALFLPSRGWASLSPRAPASPSSRRLGRKPGPLHTLKSRGLGFGPEPGGGTGPHPDARSCLRAAPAAPGASPCQNPAPGTADPCSHRGPQRKWGLGSAQGRRPHICFPHTCPRDPAPHPPAPATLDALRGCRPQHRGGAIGPTSAALGFWGFGLEEEAKRLCF